ncbi:hypothetical protein Glove_140g76 [Diversispora epigaea]|uniref:Uncharacterized protein n=1 Tax=Diversispora epigaea TaxID=1348612 RepID=A0A397IV61_9GLOM|nr:hypothetical protein Glove_140g76 [Diversispora epigaea]
MQVTCQKNDMRNVSSSLHIKEFFFKNWKLIVVILASPLAFLYGFFNLNNVPVGIYSELCRFPLSKFLLPCDQIITYDFISFRKEQENLLENLQKNAGELNPPNDKSLSLRVKDIEMVSRDFSTVVEYSDLSDENKIKLVDGLNEFADESYVVVDKIIDLDVTISMTIKIVSEYIKETYGALEKLNDVYLNLNQLKELNETYEAIISEYNSQLKELVSKAVETKTGLKKMGNLQYDMFKIVTSEKKYQKGQREYHEGTFLSNIWKFFRNNVRDREFEENLEIFQKFEQDKVKAVDTIIELELSVDKYQRKLEKLRNKVGKIQRIPVYHVCF